ncbi:MAG: hypothetical protein UC708_06385 [Anaerovoracaceae bacterium]|nr:hypothetical protein [Anaerovoracaceae bacterium]
MGELWSGSGDGQEILESESIAMYDTETDDWRTVSFEVVHHTEDILQVKVKITGICS